MNNVYKNNRKEYSQRIKNAKKASWRKFTSECEDIYLLNKIVFKKQQNSISMMEGCNTGLQTNKVLMDTHFPGSTPMDSTAQSNSTHEDDPVYISDDNDLKFLTLCYTGGTINTHV